MLNTLTVSRQTLTYCLLSGAEVSNPQLFAACGINN